MGRRPKNRNLPNDCDRPPQLATEESARRIVGSPWLAVAIIIAATLAAYSNSLHCEFVFDDKANILQSGSISHLWPLWDVFVVQSDGRSVLHGRPVINLSLAINHATGGQDPFQYHLTNLAIHLLAGLGSLESFAGRCCCPNSDRDSPPHRLRWPWLWRSSGRCTHCKSPR